MHLVIHYTAPRHPLLFCSEILGKGKEVVLLNTGLLSTYLVKDKRYIFFREKLSVKPDPDKN